MIIQPLPQAIGAKLRMQSPIPMGHERGHRTYLENIIMRLVYLYIYMYIYVYYIIYIYDIYISLNIYFFK